ncbi:MAG: type II secretion system major pseudopilin GspG [Phycisphaeraceae bacterium]|nr:type II secretion system major pseudopilin GspG [Phycisphaeraceae bacterium]
MNHGRRYGNRKVGQSRGAFTLIEVMIVLLIVLALGGLVAYNLLGTKEDAENKLAKVDMQTIQGALKQFRFEHGRYPTDEEGIEVLWNKDKMTDEEDLKKWKKLLEKPMPKDRFGSDWGYRQVSENGDEDIYDLWSNGRDRQEGTDDDITSWDREEVDGGRFGG